MTYVRNGEYRDRYSLWRATVNSSPNKIRPLHNLGVAAFHRGRHDEAAWAFNRAIEIGEARPYSPDDVVAEKALRQCYTNLFGVLMIQGRNGDAEAVLRKAVEKFRDDPDVMRVYAEHLLNKGEAAKCRTELSGYIAMHPDAYGLYYLLGTACCETRLFKEAEAALRKTLEFHDSFLRQGERVFPEAYIAEVRARLGDALAAQDKTAEAREQYVLAFRSCPDSVLASLPTAARAHPHTLEILLSSLDEIGVERQFRYIRDTVADAVAKSKAGKASTGTPRPPPWSPGRWTPKDELPRWDRD